MARVTAFVFDSLPVSICQWKSLSDRTVITVQGPFGRAPSLVRGQVGGTSNLLAPIFPFRFSLLSRLQRNSPPSYNAATRRR